MRTEFPTSNIQEYSNFVIFNADLECKQRSAYYHYTNLDNLKFILKDSCIDLRFTRADSFADKQEMLHAVPIIEDVAEELLLNGYIDEDFYSIVKHAIKDSQALLEEFRKYYVFCFSSNENSEYLKWNYACRNGNNGAVIGIHGIALEDIQFYLDGEKEKPVYGIDMYDVLYDKERLHDSFCQIIRKLYEMNTHDEESKKAIKRTVTAFISHGLVYKPSDFSMEEETRMIVDLSRLTLPKEKYYQDDDRYLHIKFPKDALYDKVIINI